MVFLEATVLFNSQFSMWNSCFVLLLLSSSSLVSAQQIKFQGLVQNNANGEPIAGVLLIEKQKGYQTHTDANGRFTWVSTKTSDSLVQLSIFAAGFEKAVLQLSASQDFHLIQLKERTQEIKEIHVKAPRENLSNLILPLEKAQKIPMLGGEPDVIKAFQYLPGVAAGTEGSSALYVRGGSPDQNLFLLDQIPLYYVSHIGGFVSTFDAQMIGAIQLYKGSFPAQYSGRLSAVVDIQMKIGNQLKTNRVFSIGLLSSKYQQEGPFKKDSSCTYLFSMRRLNLDLLTRMLARLDSGGAAKAGYTFYDGNIKVVKRFANHAQLSLFYFDGRDRIFVEAKENMQNDQVAKFENNTTWGNRLGGLQLILPTKSKILAQLTLGTTHFYYQTVVKSSIGLGNQLNTAAFNFSSKVGDIMFKTNFSMPVNQNLRMVFGSISTYHVFRPANIKNQTQMNSSNLLTKVEAFEQVFFTQLNWQIKSNWKLNLGAAFNSYLVSDTLFAALEPRISLKYTASKSGIWQLGLSKMQQNLHYATYSGSSLPTDLWLPATKSQRPETALQANLSYCKELAIAHQTIVITTDIFYKKLSYLLDFKEGVSFYAPSALNDKLFGGGKGEVYGFEFLMEKNMGQTTGWLAYTLSKNTRQFEQINNGQPYPFKYDRRHNISLVVNHHFNKRIELTGSWVFTTGSALTLGQGAYSQLDIVNSSTYGQVMYELGNAQVYTAKNAYRLPDYHRLDLSIQFKKEVSKGERTWSFSIYNAYNQMNPFFLFYDQNDKGQTTLKQLTIFPLIPAFHYQLRLK